MTTADDNHMQVRLDVAEMKGMLTVSIRNHGERIDGLEAERDRLHGRINEDRQRLAKVESLAENNAEDVSELQKWRHGQFGKGLQYAFGALAAFSTLMVIWERLSGGG